MNHLERRVLQKIGENVDSPDVFIDTDEGLSQIRDSLNDAIEEISAITGGVKATYHVPLVASSFYRLQFQRGSLGWVTDAWLVSQKRRLIQTDANMLLHENPRWLQTNATPTHYWPIGGDVIGVYPRPVNEDVLELHCVVIPGRYQSSKDRLKLKTEYDWAAVHYATSEFWASRGDAVTATNHYQKYLEIMGLNKAYPQAQEKTYFARTK
jgi:hypothetical protein